jgi:hypothetical protein
MVLVEPAEVMGTPGALKSYVELAGTSGGKEAMDMSGVGFCAIQSPWNNADAGSLRNVCVSLSDFSK